MNQPSLVAILPRPKGEKKLPLSGELSTFAKRSLEISAADRARMRQHIPNIAHASEIHHQPLEAQAKARVAAGAAVSYTHLTLPTTSNV